MSFWGRRSAISINSPSCAFLTNLAGTGGSPLLISIGGRGVELEPAFSGDLVASDGARGVKFFNVVKVVVTTPVYSCMKRERWME